MPAEVGAAYLASSNLLRGERLDSMPEVGKLNMLTDFDAVETAT